MTVSRPKFIERRASRFLAEPVSVKNAAAVITVTTTLVVLASGALMRVLDSSEYPTIGRGLWWAIQTVTTVGYGDVTPEHTSGRIVAVFLMLWGIAFVTIIVAVITSTFVSRAERERDEAGDSADDRLQDRFDERFDELSARFDELSAGLNDIGKAVSEISSRRDDD